MILVKDLIHQTATVVDVECSASSNMQCCVRLVGKGCDIVNTPCVAYTLEVAVGYYLVANGVEEGEARARYVVAGK